MKVLAIVLLLLVPACDGGEPAFTGVVPYEYIPAPEDLDEDEYGDHPEERERTPSTPSCVGRFEAEVLGGPHRNEAFNLNLIPTDGPCYIDHSPEVVIDGGEIRFRVRRYRHRSLTNYVLDSGERFNLSLSTRPAWCVEDEEPREVEIEIRFADGTLLPAGSSDDLGCEAGVPRTLLAGGWTWYPPYEPPGPLEVLEISARNVPRRVRGDAIKFEAVVSNPTDEDVPLEPCPMFRAAWGESGLAVHSYSYVNCDEAPEAIPAGESVRFAIEVPIADDLLDGEGGSYTGSLLFSIYDEEGKGAALEEYHEVEVIQR